MLPRSVRTLIHKSLPLSSSRTKVTVVPTSSKHQVLLFHSIRPFQLRPVGESSQRSLASNHTSTISTTATAVNRIRSFSSSSRIHVPIPSSSSPQSSFTMSPDSARLKLASIREILQSHRLDGYLVPSDDEHGSEYTSVADERRAYISGFTGSAGQVLVTSEKAYLWTDGRYFLQAEKELGIDTDLDEPKVEADDTANSTETDVDALKAKKNLIFPSSSTTSWTLLKQGLPQIPTPTQLIIEQIRGQSVDGPIRIGIDPRTISYARAIATQKALNAGVESSSTGNNNNYPVTLVPVEQNLVDAIWDSKPPRPTSDLLILEEKYSGELFAAKLSSIRKSLTKSGATGLVISELDQIAWLFNLRGTDIPFNPVFFAYAIVKSDECTVYLQPGSTTEGIKSYLKDGGVDVKPYDEFFPDLTAWRTSLPVAGDNQGKKAGKEFDPEQFMKVPGIDPKTKVINVKGKIMLGDKASWAIAEALGKENVAVQISPVTEAKAIKNPTEIEGFRQSHIRDGAALVRYFSWLETLLTSGGQINEHDAASQLETYRSQNEHFQGLSFPTISSTGPNGAIIHYQPSATESSIIDKDAMYLCDSGAQYLDGTTDVTRTWHFGNPSEEEKRTFTRVLQGHIGIDSVVFPENTTGYTLDILARKPLWEEGLDFGHSTGHGVGAFLNVHEGPHGIGPYAPFDAVSLKVGMTVSNEPGYYADGKYGIRIENIVIVTNAETANNFRGRKFFKFENVTMCPIQKSLIDFSLLAPSEISWLDAYHAEIREKVSPLLKEGKTKDEAALKWLEEACSPLK